ncbi:hypothetical protein ACFWOG_20470 [Kitasatospora sp. NPDC058406]|uniref:hypothetical protein n=1 Tax=Kitasatospora sp. NPDC058406 TaxID=3346483 RepID=UPI0036641C83
MNHDFDTWGNKEAAEPATAPLCQECAAPLRTAGPGRRPVYCGRSCSAKAYRRRRAESHQDALADALVSPRVETPDTGGQELLDLAAAVQRGAARYLENLEAARAGDGDDPRCVRALEILEAGLAAITGRMVRKAHVLRYEMLTARRKAEPAAAASRPRPDGASGESARVETRVGEEAPRDTAPAPSPALVPQAPAPGPPTGPADLRPAPTVARPRPGGASGESPRDETRHAQGTRQTTAPPRAVPAPTPPPTPAAAAPTELRPYLGATPVESPRVETRDAQGTRQAAGTAHGDGIEQDLALAAHRTSTPPLLRGLGAPDTTWNAQDGTFLVEGWPGRTVFAVRRPDRSLAGWVEAGDDGWTAYINGRAIIDPGDGLPWLAPNSHHAVTLLTAALGRGLA